MMHQVTKSELQNTPAETVLASSTGNGGKRLTIHYDIGRKRLTFRVSYRADGPREYIFDALDDAIEAYNEV